MITVLVTGCGGAVGLGVVKSLRKASEKLNVIGVDADPYAACFYIRDKEYFSNKTYIVPKAESPNYIPKLIKICKREEADVVFPGTDHELLKLSIAKDRLAKEGVEVIVSPEASIRICRDKWLTFSRLRKHLPIVKSALPNEGLDTALKFTGLPAIIKPRHGWGSRDIYKVLSNAEAKVLVERINDPIIQSWLSGKEYTVDGLTDKNAQIVALVPRQRIKLTAGLSSLGVTVRNQELIELGKKITKNLKIIGPFNFQVFESDGEKWIFEINPRFAGTGILSVEAGVNIPLLAVKDILGIRITSNIAFKEGVFVSRYFADVFFRQNEVISYEN